MGFEFVPPTGLNDVTQFPTKDALIRQHLQDFIQQIPTYVDAEMASKTQPNYINPTLINNWSILGSGTRPPYYMKDTLGFICIIGAILKDGASGTAAFVLPIGYRPYQNTAFCISTGIGTITAGKAVISGSDGTVTLYTSDNAVYLDGIRFKAGV